MSTAMELVDACRSPIRRQIMLKAEELCQEEKPLTATAASRCLEIDISKASFHVAKLYKLGALKKSGGRRVRGAYQAYYAPSGAFKATMVDTVALDQIAELVDGLPGVQAKAIAVDTMVPIIRATGRPVEA